MKHNWFQAPGMGMPYCLNCGIRFDDYAVKNNLKPGVTNETP